MTQVIFAFTFQPETKEASFVGNISPQQALHILQDIVLAEVQRQATQPKSDKRKREDVSAVKES